MDNKNKEKTIFDTIAEALGVPDLNDAADILDELKALEEERKRLNIRPMTTKESLEQIGILLDKKQKEIQEREKKERNN